MPAVFFMDDEAIARMKEVHDRLENLLGREIPDEEDVFITFLEVLDMLEVPTETPIIQWENSTE